MELAIQHRRIKVNGIELHTAWAGPEDGPLVVLLHGFPEYWRSWSRQISALAGAGFRVLVPDQRGYNLSEKPKGTAAYRMDVLASDVRELVTAAGRETAVIVGHDWGAAVAWFLGAAYPEMVRKLVVMNVPHPYVLRRNILGNPRQTMRSWYMFFFQLPWVPEFVLGRKPYPMEKGLLESSQPGTFSDSDFALYREAWGQVGAWTGMLNWYRAAVRRPVAMPNRGRIRAPALILWGERDIALVKEMAAQSLKYCQDGRLHSLPDATHWVQHEEPDWVNSKLLEFLSAD